MSAINTTPANKMARRITVVSRQKKNWPLWMNYLAVDHPMAR
jgi:hypothetical protein